MNSFTVAAFTVQRQEGPGLVCGWIKGSLSIHYDFSFIATANFWAAGYSVNLHMTGHRIGFCDTLEDARDLLEDLLNIFDWTQFENLDFRSEKFRRVSAELKKKLIAHDINLSGYKRREQKTNAEG